MRAPGCPAEQATPQGPTTQFMRVEPKQDRRPKVIEVYAGEPTSPHFTTTEGKLTVDTDACDKQVRCVLLH